MAVCEQYRIPHSHFLGGPLVWTQADRDKAIWWRRWQAETCPRCQTRPWEWDEHEGGHRRAYRAEVEICPGCEVLERAESQQAADQEDAPPLRGARIVLKHRSEVRSDPNVGAVDA